MCGNILPFCFLTKCASLVVFRAFYVLFSLMYVPDVLFNIVSKMNISVTHWGIGYYSTFQWKYISVFLGIFLV